MKLFKGFFFLLKRTGMVGQSIMIASKVKIKHVSKIRRFYSKRKFKEIVKQFRFEGSFLKNYYEG